MKLFAPTGEWIAEQRLPWQQHQIIWVILSHLDYNNTVLISQKEVSERLGMSFQNVSRAFRHLVEIGFLEETGFINRRKSYRINPNLAYKGREPAKVISMPSRRS